MQVRNTHSFDDYFRGAEENSKQWLEESGELIQLLRQTHTFCTTTLWAEVENVGPLPATLAMNAFTLWLAGVKVAITGHQAAVFPILRTALESACYAFLMARDETLETLWMSRSKDEASWKACRRAFTSAVADASKGINEIQPESGDWIYEAYQTAIDYGGHPNIRGVFGHVTMADEPDYNVVKLTGLHHADSGKAHQGVVAAADFGLAISIVLTRAMNGRTEVLQNALNDLADAKEAAVASLHEPEES